MQLNAYRGFPGGFRGRSAKRKPGEITILSEQLSIIIFLIKYPIILFQKFHTYSK